MKTTAFHAHEEGDACGWRHRAAALTTENRTLKTSGAFTLIELLVVIVIVGILAALILNAAKGVQTKAYRSQIEVTIKALGSALEEYKIDNGDYPGGSNAADTLITAPGDNNFLLTNLMPPTSGKVYFEFKKTMTNTSGYIVDPYGDPYGYSYPGSTSRNGTNFFDLWSRAGTNNTNVWIKNW